jgi:predicted DNA-binding protein (MmcQ/YjbR family)
MTKATTPRPLAKLRKICLALPNASEKLSHGEPTFWAPKRMFASFADASTHHGNGRHAAWIKAAPGRQERMVRTAPDRFFVPPYVGVSGWIGVWLDDVCDWDELAEILKSAHELAQRK